MKEFLLEIMAKYNRVPTVSEPDEAHSEDAEERRIPLAVDKNITRGNATALKRRVSRGRSYSSGSYSTGRSDNCDSLNRHDNEEFPMDEAERSPLNVTKKKHVDGNDLTEGSLSTSSSPSQRYPSLTAIYLDSFDLEDDEDELEENLKRYHLDFSATDRVDPLFHNNSGPDTNQYDSRGVCHRCSVATKSVWFFFQSVRQRARQRRAELLLEQTERNWRQSLKICILTNCDATDSGIMFVVVMMVLWIVVLLSMKDPLVRRKGLILGIVFFVVRVGARPLYDWLLKLWQRRQVLLNQQRHVEVPQSSPNRKGRSGDSTDQHENHHPHLTFSNGALEMHVVCGGSDNKGDPISPHSTGSDPTIAAI